MFAGGDGLEMNGIVDCFNHTRPADCQICAVGLYVILFLFEVGSSTTRLCHDSRAPARTGGGGFAPKDSHNLLLETKRNKCAGTKLDQSRLSVRTQGADVSLRGDSPTQAGTMQPSFDRAEDDDQRICLSRVLR